MKPELVPIESVQPDPKNSKKHSEENITLIAASLRRFGQQRPIIVAKEHNGLTDVVIAGNGTYLAAKNVLNWKEIYVIFTELKGEEALAYSIGDNKTSSTEYDLPLLAESIQFLAQENPEQDWFSLGFSSSDEIEPLLTWETEQNTNVDIDPDDNLEEDKKDKVKGVKLTKEQREIFERVVSHIRKEENDNNMSEGRVLELISADFLAGIL